jgi:hypothetical protein
MSSLRTCEDLLVYAEGDVGEQELPSIWHVSPDDQGNLLLGQLLHCNLQWIRLAFQIDKNWCVHAAILISLFLVNQLSAHPLT